MALPTLTELAAGHGFTAGDLDTSGIVAVTPAFQKVYFADGRDYDASINDSGYHKLDMINTKLVGVASGAFTAGEIVTQATSGAKGVFAESVGNNHYVYRLTTTEFNATNVVTGADSSETVTPSSVTAPPHWLNWILTAGSFPSGGSNIMALGFGRIFMNDLGNPHHWYATRAGDPLDLQLSQDDLGTAVAHSSTKAGEVGDELVAFIPYHDHYMLFGCVNEMWVLRSDPAAGGTLTNLSDSTGIFGSQAWCWDDKNNLYFLGTDGLYGISAASLVNSESPMNLTKDHLPKLITDMGINRRTDRISMAYDKQRYGIAISVVQMDAAWSTNLWVDLRTGGVFPEQYQSDHIPASMLYFDSRRADRRGLLLGGQDGYIREFDETEKSDDGDNAISSWAVIGPMTTRDNPRQQLKINELSVVSGEDTDGITIEIYKAKTSDELVHNVLSGVSPLISRTFSGDGIYSSIRQKVKGGAIAIKLSNDTADESWSIEKILATIAESGRIK